MSTENKKPLLSIAIPTWNRAKFLKNALSRLLPQINEFNEYIEFIISDNASTDNTQDVIESFRLKFPDIHFISFIQKTNTGFYGNFRKCRELASGEYFWLLSDNDYLIDHVLEKIIRILIDKRGIGLVFLKGWVLDIPKELNYFTSDVIDFNKLFYSERLFPTLISASIILNTKDEDDYLFDKYRNNSFFGFILLIKSGKSSPNAVIIDGPSLLVDKKAEIKWNVFNSFIEDINECLDYLKSGGYVKNEIIDLLKGTIIKEHIKAYYVIYKSTGRAYGAVDIPMTELHKRIWRYFKNHRNFWFFVFPFMLIPAGFLRFYESHSTLKYLKRKLL